MYLICSNYLKRSTNLRSNREPIQGLLMVSKVDGTRFVVLETNQVIG